MNVITEGGRTVEVDDIAKTTTVAHVADELAPHDGVFSLKIDGTVAARGSRVAAHVQDDSIVELVEITPLPTDGPFAEVVDVPDAEQAYDDNDD